MSGCIRGRQLTEYLHWEGVDCTAAFTVTEFRKHVHYNFLAQHSASCHLSSRYNLIAILLQKRITVDVVAKPFSFGTQIQTISLGLFNVYKSLVPPFLNPKMYITFKKVRKIRSKLYIFPVQERSLWPNMTCKYKVIRYHNKSM